MFQCKHRIKQIALILMVASLLIVSTPNASAKSLGLSNRKQQKTLWCWAACAEIIGRYYGNYATQSSICSYVMGNSDNQNANFFEAATAIQYVTGEVTAIRYRALTESEISQEINTDEEPFEIRIGWNGSFTNGHFVVCGGYTSGSLEICNPLDSNGDSYDYDYSDLVNGVDLTGGYGIWTHTTIISS